jgi:hypothetical protein
MAAGVNININQAADFGHVNVLNNSPTVLDTATVTSCVPNHPKPTGDDTYVTVYTTEYVHVCPTETPCPKGTETQTCTGAQSDYTPPSIPPNFTTVVQVCGVCEGKPTLTVTCPLTAATQYPGTPSNGSTCNGTDCKVTAGSACTGDACKAATGTQPATSACTGGACTKPYVQASIASTRTAEFVAVIFGGLIGLVAWVL